MASDGLPVADTGHTLLRWLATCCRSSPSLGDVKALQRRPDPGLMIHSDQGVQYCCDGFRKMLCEHQFVQSMSRRGNCWDNAVAESFFRSLKTEWFYHIDLRELFAYIEGFYNNQRLHTYLNYLSPAVFEKLKQKNAA